MINEPFENLYFNWLCAKVVFNMNPTPSLTYWTLLRTLHSTEFVWLLSGDDNRAEDGLELRVEFIFEAEAPDDPNWRRFPPCSVLEMLIAFSRRAAFATDEKAKDWFWEFIDNLGLKECNDGSNVTPEEIGEILDNFIWRTYDSRGRGGLFPIDNRNGDEREVEIWYQFCHYLDDKGRMP
jgi:hypothetical protein